MAIETTLGALLTAEPALTRLMQRDWPLAMSFRLTRLARAVRAETSTFETLRQTLVRKFGTDPDRDGNIQVAPAHLGEFSRQVTDAAAMAVVLDVAPLTETELIVGAPPEMRLSPMDLWALGPLFLSDGSSSPCEA